MTPSPPRCRDTRHRPKHLRALPHADVGAALRAVRESDVWPATRLAFEFLVLTATRSGEARLATWAEVDLEARVWEIPGERMKSRRPHRLPLSSRAMKVLGEALTLADGSGMLFPGARGSQISKMAMLDMLRNLHVGATPQPGFHSSFRDWCAECTDAPREVAEQALAHVNTNRVEAAYMRSDLFERRRGAHGGVERLSIANRQVKRKLTPLPNGALR